jgi:hypothetical protein
VIVVLHETAHIASTDVLIARDIAHLFTIRDGRVAKWQVFETRAEALEAVGLAA